MKIDKIKYFDNNVEYYPGERLFYINKGERHSLKVLSEDGNYDYEFMCDTCFFNFKCKFPNFSVKCFEVGRKDKKNIYFIEEKIT